jgi:tetratricopeptide (TPR) repeat protein
MFSTLNWARPGRFPFHWLLFRAGRALALRHYRFSLSVLTVAGEIGFNLPAGSAPIPNNDLVDPRGPAVRAQSAFLSARARHESEPRNLDAAWQFARACFDRAEFATNRAERAAIAEQGIDACRQAVARATNSAPAHYYLAMNLGQLAQTKMLGALKIVPEMEREFKTVRTLDERFDYAGPDRNLGLLYCEAPAIGSIGSRTKARQHLERAVELLPDYPENRLNLLEACLKWGDRTGAQRELKSLEALWPRAQTNLPAEVWAANRTDWNARLEKARKKIDELPKRFESPREKS